MPPEPEPRSYRIFDGLVTVMLALASAAIMSLAIYGGITLFHVFWR